MYFLHISLFKGTDIPAFIEIAVGSTHSRNTNTVVATLFLMLGGSRFINWV